MKPRTLVPHIAAALVVAGCTWLTLWQIDRAAEKRELLARWNQSHLVPLASLALPYELPQRVTGVGIWDRERQVLLDNRIRDRRQGVGVLTPLRLADGRVFLVDRGWAHRESREAALPDPDLSPEAARTRTGDTTATIEGVLAEPPGAGLRLGDSDAEAPDRQWPRLVTYLDHERLTEWFGPDLQRPVIRLSPEHPAHLTGDAWQFATFGPERHLGYAVTWTLIALVVAGIWIALTWKQWSERTNRTR